MACEKIVLCNEVRSTYVASNRQSCKDSDLNFDVHMKSYNSKDIFLIEKIFQMTATVICTHDRWHTGISYDAC